METPEKRKADALASVSGFAFHIQDAIRNTPADNVSRSRIVDRCLFVGPIDRHLQVSLPIELHAMQATGIGTACNLVSGPAACRQNSCQKSCLIARTFKGRLSLRGGDTRWYLMRALPAIRAGWRTAIGRLLQST